MVNKDSIYLKMAAMMTICHDNRNKRVKNCHFKLFWWQVVKATLSDIQPKQSYTQDSKQPKFPIIQFTWTYNAFCFWMMPVNI